MDHIDLPTGIASFFLGSATTAILLRYYLQATGRITLSPPPLPDWATQLQSNPKLQHVVLREWHDEEFRKTNGWVGNDLCHSRWSNGVRILDYYWNKDTQELTGIVFFGSNCESHRGLCHGGAYTSAFDDFTGHIAFVHGQPWFGATVQVNVGLKQPIPIGAVLRMHGKVTQNKRKLIITAVLDDGADTTEYAQ